MSESAATSSPLFCSRCGASFGSLERKVSHRCSAASADPHDLAVQYIDRSISAQVALGYAKPSAERRARAIEAAEREIWKLGGLVRDAR